MRHLRYILPILVVLFVVGVFYLVLPPALPSYQEQSLAFWFKKLPPAENRGGFIFGHLTCYGELITYGTFDGKEWPQTLRAIQTIGTNGLPYIMMKFTRADKNKLQTWLEKAGSKMGIRISFGYPKRERKQAVTALLANIPLPPDVVATLSNLSTSTNRELSSRAKYVLSVTAKGRKLDLEGPESSLDF